MGYFTIYIPHLLFALFVTDFKDMFNQMLKYSKYFILFVWLLIFSTYTGKLNTEELNYMQISYSMTFPIAIYAVNVLSNDTKPYKVLFLVITMLAVLFIGCRGAFLSVLVCCILVYIFKNKIIGKRLFSIIIATFFFIFIFADLVEFMNELLLHIGYNSRFLSKLDSGEIFESAGRELLIGTTMNAASSNGFPVYGPMGDRYLTQSIGFEPVYVHNIVLELIIDFGLYGGIALFIFFMFAFIRGLVVSYGEQRMLLLVLITPCLIKLMFSNSYLIEPQFYASIGIMTATYLSIKREQINMPSKKMSKILIITYDMIPHAKTWGGCQRMYFLSKGLLNKGHDVEIIALRSEKYNTFGHELLPKVTFTEKIKETKSNKEPKQANNKLSSYSTLGDFVRKTAFCIDRKIFNEIQDGAGFVAFHRCRKAKKVIEKTVRDNHYDAIIISGPPFELFSFLPMIKKLSNGAKLIMDYRDPWNFWHKGNKLTTKREKSFHKLVDAVVCTNSNLAEDMKNEFGFHFDKYYVCANGYVGKTDIVTKYNRSVNDGIMEIVYSGSIGFGDSIDEYRDTKCLFSAFEQILEEEKVRIKLVFVGVNNMNSERVKAIKNKYGKNGDTRKCPWLRPNQTMS